MTAFRALTPHAKAMRAEKLVGQQVAGRHRAPAYSGVPEMAFAGLLVAMVWNPVRGQAAILLDRGDQCDGYQSTIDVTALLALAPAPRQVAQPIDVAGEQVRGG